MDLRYSEEQKILRNTVREFAKRRVPKTLVRELEEDAKGFSTDIWKEVANLGLLGCAIPSCYGGVGASFMDLTVLFEEMGRACIPGPFLPTVVASLTILDDGIEEAKASLLPDIAQGELILTIAALESEGITGAKGINVKATPKGGNFTVRGTKFFVEMAHVADRLLLATRTTNGKSAEDGITLFVANTRTHGISTEVIPTMGMDKLCEVRFDDVILSRQDMLGGTDEGWPIWQKSLERGALIKCAESVGGMQACVETTVNYSKDRVQYGNPIGSYQALQHIMADMWISMQTSRYLTYEAAWMESERMPCAKEVSMAKAYVNEAYKYVTKWGVRLHGAIGTTREQDVALYYRKAKAADTVFGGTDYHRDLVADKMGLLRDS